MTARTGLAFFFGLPAVLFAGAWVAISRSTPHTRVVARVDSPDGGRTATVVEIDDGSSRPMAYAARVGEEDALVAFGAKGMTVRWRDDRTLEVAFGHALSTETGKVADLKVVPEGTVGGRE